MGGKFEREVTCVYLWLVHVDVWQKPTQYCKAIIPQLKINKQTNKQRCWLLEKRLETDTSRGKLSAGGGMNDFQVGGAHPARSLLFLSVPVTRLLPTQPSSSLTENPGQLTLSASVFSPVKWRNNTSLIQ